MVFREVIEPSGDSNGDTGEALNRRNSSPTGPFCTERTRVTVVGSRGDEEQNLDTPALPKVDDEDAQTTATDPNGNFDSATVVTAAGYDAEAVGETRGDRGQKHTDRASAKANGGAHNISAALPYPKRKCKFVHPNLNDDDIENSQTGPAADSPPPSVRDTKKRMVHWESSVKAVLDYWRD
ncbi:hypothetical protein ACCO45_012319 [Purpureocillium lilacinum]|uniref:Uncharacterized protein n=1 Tax=Purpureocillium lilacinum TaxID=33203 RepID=A0ACC4DA59_PURLI